MSTSGGSASIPTVRAALGVDLPFAVSQDVLDVAVTVGTWTIAGQVTLTSTPGANAEVALAATTAVVSSGGTSGGTALGAGLTSVRTVSLTDKFVVTTAGLISITVVPTAAVIAKAATPVNGFPGATLLVATKTG